MECVFSNIILIINPKIRIMKKLNLFYLLLFVFGLTACSDDDKDDVPYIPKTIAEQKKTLSETAWITTDIRDEKGQKVDPKTNPAANVYVGYAYYKTNDEFRIVDLNNGHKMFGLWDLVAKDNKTYRSLTAYKSDNTVAFKRDVEVLTLTNRMFTYRINYDNSDNTKYFDVDHVPTKYAEPKLPAQILAETEWKTTNVYNITAYYSGDVGSTANNNPVNPSLVDESKVEAANLEPMDNTQAPASGYAGDAFYSYKVSDSYFPKVGDNYVNGTFKITEYNALDKVRSFGDWYVSLDAKTRTLYAKNAEGAIAWSRVVSIHELSPDKFTYDIVHGDVVLRVEHVKK